MRGLGRCYRNRDRFEDGSPFAEVFAGCCETLGLAVGPVRSSGWASPPYRSAPEIHRLAERGAGTENRPMRLDLPGRERKPESHWRTQESSPVVVGEDMEASDAA